MHQIRFRLRPRPLGELTALPGLLAGFQGSILLRKGREREIIGNERKGSREKEEKREEPALPIKVVPALQPPPIVILLFQLTGFGSISGTSSGKRGGHVHPSPPHWRCPSLKMCTCSADKTIQRHTELTARASIIYAFDVTVARLPVALCDESSRCGCRCYSSAGLCLAGGQSFVGSKCPRFFVCTRREELKVDLCDCKIKFVYRLVVKVSILCQFFDVENRAEKQQIHRWTTIDNSGDDSMGHGEHVPPL